MGDEKFFIWEKKKISRKWSQSPRKKSPKTQELTPTIIFIREIYMMVPHIKPTPVKIKYFLEKFISPVTICRY